MNSQVAQMTYNRLELLKLMYLSREGDRREGVLHRQSKGWFQVAGMGHEPMAVISQLMEEDDYLFPYYRDRAMVLGRGITNAELASAYFAKRGAAAAAGSRCALLAKTRAALRRACGLCMPHGTHLLYFCFCRFTGAGRKLPRTFSSAWCLARRAASLGIFGSAQAFGLGDIFCTCFLGCSSWPISCSSASTRSQLSQRRAALRESTLWRWQSQR